MHNRRRWYAELAGTILLWVEEIDGPPPLNWCGKVLRRPTRFPIETQRGVVEIEWRPSDSFSDRSLESAIANVNITVRNDQRFNDYAHRLNEVIWKEFRGSDEEWERRVGVFVATGEFNET